MNDSVGSFLGPSGGCPSVEFQGKSWKIGHPTQNAKAELERLAVAKADEEIAALEGVLSPDRFKKKEKAFLQEITAGSYRTWGEGWERVVFSPANGFFFLLALLRENHADASATLAKEMAAKIRHKLEVALAQVVPDFFSLLLAEHPIIVAMKQALREQQPTEEQSASIRTALSDLMAKASVGMMGMTKDLAERTFSTVLASFDEVLLPIKAA